MARMLYSSWVSVGCDRVRQALDDTSRFLDSIIEQTLQRINKGQSLNEILHSIQIDQDLLKVGVSLPSAPCVTTAS